MAKAHPSKRQASLYMATLVVGVASLLYVYEFFLRVTPGALAIELMQSFDVHAATFGFAMSSFFMGLYAHANTCWAFGRSLWTADLIDHCGAYLCSGDRALCLNPKHRHCRYRAIFYGRCRRLWIYLSTDAGTTLVCEKIFCLDYGYDPRDGVPGAIIGGGPVASFANALGWRQAMLIAAVIGLVLSVCFWTIVRDHPGQQHQKVAQKQTQISELTRLKLATSNPQTWAIALVGLCFWAPMSIFAELWGTPFLMGLEHIDAVTASEQIAWVWLGVSNGRTVFRLVVRSHPITPQTDHTESQYGSF